MDEVEGQGHQIVGSNVTISAAVDGASEDDLAAAIGRADEGCPFSAAPEAGRRRGLGHPRLTGRAADEQSRAGGSSYPETVTDPKEARWTGSWS